MNKHFEDTRYYLRRAAQTTRAGFGEELEPVRARVEAVRGGEEETPGRFDGVRARVRRFEARLRSEFERVRGTRATR